MPYLVHFEHWDSPTCMCRPGVLSTCSFHAQVLVKSSSKVNKIQLNLLYLFCSRTCAGCRENVNTIVKTQLQTDRSLMCRSGM